jgi:hypothetical protein
MDEVGRDSDDGAEGEWVIEQEAWMGEDLWRPKLHAAQHCHEWTSLR